MARIAPNLFAEDAGDPSSDEMHVTGLLPVQHLRGLIERSREICSLVPIEPGQLQPASLDLRLGATAWRVRASFLPGEEATVQDKIDAFAMHRFELTEAGAVLERGLRLHRRADGDPLRKRTSAIANPKSSIGRIDVFVHRRPPRILGDKPNDPRRLHSLSPTLDKTGMWI